MFIGKVQAEGQDKAEEEGSAESCNWHDCPAVTEAAPCWNSGTLCLHQCLPIWHTWVCTRCVSSPRRPPEWPAAHTSKYNSFDCFSLFTVRFISLKYVCLPSSSVYHKEDTWRLQANTSWQLGATQPEVYRAAIGSPARSHHTTHILRLKRPLYLSIRFWFNRLSVLFINLRLWGIWHLLLTHQKQTV